MSDTLAGNKRLSSFEENSISSSQLAWIKQAKQGNQQSFGKLYELFFDRIYRFIFFRVNHKEEAEDLTEEVFTKAWKNIGNVKIESFSGWLYRIAKNTIIDHYRQEKVTIDLYDLENVLESNQNLSIETDLLLDKKTLLKLIKQLTPEQQIIVQLKFIEDLNNEEISELISKNEGSIRVTQHRAIIKLQELFSDHINNHKNHKNS